MLIDAKQEPQLDRHVAPLRDVDKVGEREVVVRFHQASEGAVWTAGVRYLPDFLLAFGQFDPVEIVGVCGFERPGVFWVVGLDVREDESPDEGCGGPERVAGGGLDGAR